MSEVLITGREPHKPPVHTWKATTAGILTIIAGSLNIIIGILAFTLFKTFWDSWSVYFNMPVMPMMGIENLSNVLETIFIIIGIISIIGGIFALKRRLWGLSLTGAILALFPPQIAVLGILSIIFVAMGKNEFD
jgi:hypothetical protein